MLSPPTFLANFIDIDNSINSGSLSSLRTFRLFRIFKLAKSWKAMHKLLLLIMKTCLDITNFAFLLGLFMYIYSLLGMQFFANRLTFDEYGYAMLPGQDGYDDGDVPRANYDNLTWAFTTVFGVLSGENWNSAMYDGWRAIGMQVGWSCVLFPPRLPSGWRRGSSGQPV